MSAPYPNGGTPPSSFPFVPVHPISEHALPYTGTSAGEWFLVGLAVVLVGLALWGIARVGRRHV